MDHLLDFPSDARKTYETTLENLGGLLCQLNVPFKSRRARFNEDDFENLIKDQSNPSRDHYDSLLEKGPEAINLHGLSSRVVPEQPERGEELHVEQTEAHEPEVEAPDVEEFLQSWLFFSLISRVVGEDIDVQNYVRQDASHVQSRPLRRLLEKWRTRETSRRDVDGSRYRSIDQALDSASRFMSEWSSKIGKWNISPVLWLSFSVIGETLTRAWLKIQKEINYDGGASERRWGTNVFLRQMIIKRGWCPSATTMVLNTFGSLSGLYILGGLKPPENYINGTAKPANADTHKNCTDFVCSAFIISGPQNHFPFHHTKHCPLKASDSDTRFKIKCRTLGPDRRMVEDVLLRGNIPLVRLGIQDEGVPWGNLHTEVIQVVEYSLITKARPLPYTAISHVWSDGLGNPHGNTLPLCRLLEIQDMINDFYRDEDENALFWLDTLCIPRADSPSGKEEPIRLKECRKAAIRGIDAVYTHAARVLVLDYGLQQVDESNGLEPLLRINLSNWARRLWTLQEGTLCDKLFFRFAHGVILDSAEIERRFKAADKNLHLSWVDCAQIFNPTIRSLANRQHEREHIVAHVWQAVQWRGCERPEDETVCLATLMEMDQSSLLELKNDQKVIDTPDERKKEELLGQRMCSFLSLVDEKYGIPSGFLFVPGPKLDAEGYRWAPRTWMASAERQFPYPLFLKREQRMPTFLTKRGLLVQHEGIRLLQTPALSGREFMVALKGQALLVEKTTDECRYLAEDEHDNLLESDQQKMAIIYCRSDPGDRPEIALLVAIVKERDAVRWVHYICRVWVSPINQPGKLETMNIHLRRRKERLAVGGARMGSTRQEVVYWCVDGRHPVKVKEKPEEFSPPGNTKKENAGSENSQSTLTHPVVGKGLNEAFKAIRHRHLEDYETAARLRLPSTSYITGADSHPYPYRGKQGFYNTEDFPPQGRLSNLTPAAQLRAKPEIPPKIPQKPAYLASSVPQI
jgi:hypothetical protein